MTNPTGEYRKRPAAEYAEAVEEISAVQREWLSKAPEEAIWTSAVSLVNGAVKDPSLALFTLATDSRVGEGMQKFCCQAIIAALYRVLENRAKSDE